MTTDAKTKLIAGEFPQIPGIHYFNHAALGPWPLRTREAVNRFVSQCGTDLLRNWPSWHATEQQLRRRIGRVLGAAQGSDDISMTKNTSEGLSLIASGLDWQPGDQIVTLKEEFSSNRWPWQHCTAAQVSVREVQRDLQQPAHEALMAACGPRTRLIAASTVQYVSGEALNLAALSQFCRQRNILLVIDAIQSLGAMPLDLSATPVDALACGSHKWLLAAEGLGFLYTSPALRERLSTSQAGWRMVSEPFQFPAQPLPPAPDGRVLEAGTLNTVGMVALNASLSLYEELGAELVEDRIRRNSARLIETALAKGMTLATPKDPDRHGGIVSLKLASEEHTRRLFSHLGEQGAVATMRGHWLRLSPHYCTPLSQIDRLCGLLTDYS